MDSDASIFQLKDSQEVQKVNGLFSFWLNDDDPNTSAGVNDMALQLILDPEGLFVAKVDGEVVATMTAINYGDNYAFVGFFRTDKRHRGKGFGGKLWRAGLAHCGQRTVGMSSALELVEYYGRYGFEPYCRAGCYKVDNLERTKNPVDQENGNIVDIRLCSLRDILEFDRKYAPAPREKFMEAWIMQAGSIALAYVDSGVVRGYGVVRKTYEPHISRLGPLFATSEGVAEKLATALLGRIEGEAHVLYEAFNANPSTARFAEFLNAEWLRDDEIMYRNGTPKFDLTGIFVVTSGTID